MLMNRYADAGPYRDRQIVVPRTLVQARVHEIGRKGPAASAPRSKRTTFSSNTVIKVLTAIHLPKCQSPKSKASTSTSFEMAALILLAFSAILLTIYVLQNWWNRRNQLPLPPGPRPWPIIENMLDMPKPGMREWVEWTKHRALYGPVSAVSALGFTFILCNEAEVARDLLERSSAANSSRPHLTFGGEMVGFQDALPSMKYGKTFQTFRRNFYNILGTSRLASKFHPTLDVENRRFLLRILEKPDRLVHHARTEAAAVIFDIVYGYKVQPHGKDPLVSLAVDTLTDFSYCYGAGMWLVDLIRPLKYLPEWFPGAGFQTKARLWSDTLNALVESPYQWVKKRIQTGDRRASFVESLLESKEGPVDSHDDYIHRWSAVSVWIAGADTTVSAMGCFFLAISFRPELQRMAKEEIDAVVGTHRLPTWEDREKLPLIQAIYKETLRWHPAVPGVAHSTVQEQVYRGCRIPKGALVYPNIWAYCHDPETYTDPLLFKPERFLGDKPETDPAEYVWGFGRRVCPGRIIADFSIWINIATSLACFDVKRRDNHPVGLVASAAKPEYFVAGTVSHAMPYDVDVTVRDEHYANLIRQVEVEHPFGKSDADALREEIGGIQKYAAEREHEIRPHA